MQAFTNASSAKNTINIAPTFSARCNPSTVPRAIAPNTFDSRSVAGISTRPAVRGCSVSGTSILAISNVPGAVMITAVKRLLASAPPTRMYAAIMPPEMCAMPLVIIGHQLGFGQLGQKWTNGERRFRLAHEDAGRYIERLGAAGAHHNRHHPRGR